jgi:uncharacterized membrane protein
MRLNRHFTRLRQMLVAFTLPIVVVVAFLLYAYVTSSVSQSQTTIVCISARANIDQLTALREISDQLGVPVTFTIPEVPPECDGS